MNDEEMEQLIRAKAQDYRAPKPPDLDRLWIGIERRAFGPSRWRQPLALAATLVIGIGLGWSGSRLAPRPVAVQPAPAAGASEFVPVRLGPSPFVGLARDYFQQTTALLVALAGDLREGRVQAGTVARAKDLLSTTRLLLDGNATDAGVQELLEDLELVLAQVVRLPEGRGVGTDTELIAEAMDRREVLSRLTLIISDRETAP